MSVITSGNPGLNSTSPALTQGKVENATIAAANVEQSHTFPANTKAFMLQARGNAKIKMSFDAGTSGTTFHTIWPGAFYCRDSIAAASTTIYFQSPLAGLVVELTSWA